MRELERLSGEIDAIGKAVQRQTVHAGGERRVGAGKADWALAGIGIRPHQSIGQRAAVHRKTDAARHSDCQPPLRSVARSDGETGLRQLSVHGEGQHGQVGQRTLAFNNEAASFVRIGDYRNVAHSNAR